MKKIELVDNPTLKFPNWKSLLKQRGVEWFKLNHLEIYKELVKRKMI